jgi:hypothetical protein
MVKNKLIVYIPFFGAKVADRSLQRKLVQDFLREPHDHEQEVVAEFEETETGLVLLRKALAKARSTGYGLLIPRIGYLSKNLKFLRVLAEEGTDVMWRALDDVRFNPVTFQLYLTEAKNVFHARRDLIKDRMATAKKNGAKFGSQRRGAKTKNWRAAEPWNAAAEASVAARAARVDAAYAEIVPEIEKMRKKGMSFTEIATALNEAGHLTTGNKPFSAPTVFKIMKRHKRQGGQNDSSGRKGLGSKAHAGAAR